MKLTLLSQLSDEYLFWPGSAFRKMNVGMNGVPYEKDFYDYMLISTSWNDEHMLMANVTIGNAKAGYVICYVPRALSNGSTVTAQAVRQAIGDDFYYLDGNI